MYVNIAIFILRLGIGIIFMAHGSQKLFGAFGGSGLKGFSGMLDGLGFKPALFWAWLVALSEGLGGLFIALGIIPRISAFLIASTMVVAILKIHGPKGFFMSGGGFEYQFLILMSCICLMIGGGGKISIFNKF